MNRLQILVLSFIMLAQVSCISDLNETILDTNHFRHYIDKFNANDNELYPQHIPNDSVLSFLSENIPFIEIPDKVIEETYYFRWWTYRKHIKNTPEGFVITEFLPNVPWSGKYNVINCPAGHQIYEGRWLRNRIYIDDYIKFYLRDSGKDIRRYSFWVADATWAFQKIHPNTNQLKSQYDRLVANYAGWEKERMDPNKDMFWQMGDRDGMEVSVGERIRKENETTKVYGGIRPTLNSYMYGDAMALSQMAELWGNHESAKNYSTKATKLKSLIQERLWSKKLAFFSSLNRQYTDESKPINVRELLGFVPWYFNLPDDSKMYVEAWNQVIDTVGFAAPYGLTVCERRHPYFEVSYDGHECQWNGPSWPFATTQTLKGLSNLLNNYDQTGEMTNKVFFNLLQQFANSHYITNENGTKQNWIDENLNPFTGDWISRTRLKDWENGTWSPSKGGVERGKDYNHSGFCDLIISDLIGLKPRIDNTIEINPLVPKTWDWFCLDRINYHGKELTIIWDKTGEKYNKGSGLMLFIEGVLSAKSNRLEKIEYSF